MTFANNDGSLLSEESQPLLLINTSKIFIINIMT